MIIRSFEIDTEEHALMLEKHVSKLAFVKLVNDQRKITPIELAFGIGRPITNEEWQQYLHDFPNSGNSISADEARKHLKEKLLNPNEH